MKSTLMGILASVVACQAFPAGARAGTDASFQGLGDLAGGAFGSFAFAVSGNGLVVVGSSQSASGLEAFRWTAAGGMVGLGDLPGGEFLSGAGEVSFDGAVVVGGSSSTNSGIGQFEAYRWTAAGGMVGLGDLPQSQFRSTAFGVSANGAVVVGQGASLAAGMNRTEAFRWTAASGMVAMGDLPGGVFWSMATAVSADGATIVGAGATDIGFEPFKWTADGGLVRLGDPVGNYFPGTPFDISADASTVVGRGTDFDTGRIDAYRWTSATGFVRLGSLSGALPNSHAYGVSGNGGVVVGECISANGQTREAFIWRPGTGMQRVQTLLTSQSVDLTGWTLRSAEGVSDDGRVIVGWGINPSGNTEGWLARLCTDTDGDGICNTSDACPGTPMGEFANANGCSCSQLPDPTCDDGDPCTLDACAVGECSHDIEDEDGDGVCDLFDACSATPNGEPVNPDGCSCSQLPDPTCDDGDPCTVDTCEAGECSNVGQDEDEDGVCDNDDFCSGTPMGELVNPDGCSCGQLPDPTCNDGDPCTVDACAAGECTHEPPDKDGDNVPDDCDPPLGGDIDGDGDIDLFDFVTFAICITSSGVTTPPDGCTADEFAACDLDGDLDVDLIDFVTFSANFGT